MTFFKKIFGKKTTKVQTVPSTSKEISTPPGPNIEQMKINNDVEGLIRELSDWSNWRYEYIQRSAAVALGEIKDARAVEPLIKILVYWKSVDPAGRGQAWQDLRYAVSEALANIGDVRGVEPILASLQSFDQHVKWKPADALAKFGPSAIEVLITSLRENKEDTVREIVAEALGKIGDANAAISLVESIKIAGLYKKSMRSIASKALVQLGAPAVEPLLAALNDENRWVREDVINILSEIRDARAVEPIISILKDKDPAMRKFAVEALGKIRDARAVEPLIDLLDDGVNNYVLPGASSEALAMIGAPAIDPLIAILKESGRRQTGAASALGEIGDARAVDPLIALLKDDSEYVKAAAASALGKIGDARAVEPLIAALKTALKLKEQSIGMASAEALGRFRDARAVEPLKAALQAEIPLVRKRAAEALRLIGNPRAVEALINFKE